MRKDSQEGPTDAQAPLRGHNARAFRGPEPFRRHGEDSSPSRPAEARRFEVILFDADGTLFDFERAEAHALRAAFADLGEPWSEELLPIYQRINKSLWRELEKGRITAGYLRTERFAQFCREAGVKADPLAFARSYLKRLGEGSFLIEGAEAVVRRLSARHRLAIITNGLSEVQHARIARSPIADLFESIVVSEEVGVQKPEAGIFRIAFQLLGVSDRSRALMVGDSLSSDIQGGINFGIATCWLNRRPSAAAPSGPRPDWMISDLRELPAIVEDSSAGEYNTP